MNVDVLNRSGVRPASTSKLAIADCDIHPRPAGVGIGGVSKSLYPYLSKRWLDHVETFGISYRQPWEKGSAYPKGQPQACRRDAFRPMAARRAATWRSWPNSTSTRTTWRWASSTR